MGGPKAKKKPKKEQKPVTYSQFTKKPPAKLKENKVPIKNGKLVGDVQIAWVSYSEDEKGKISTLWHLLKIDKKFAEEHLSGAKPGVIEAAMKAAAEGKGMKEIQDVLVKGIVIEKPKPLPYTYIDEKGRKILVLKVPKPKTKPLPYTYIDEKGQKILELKIPKKEKPKVVEKPEKKPGKKPKGAADIEDILAKVKGAKPTKAEEALGGIAGPGESKAAELGKLEAGGAATGKVKTTGPEEKGIVSDIKIAESESKPAGSSSAANAMLKSVDATFTTVGATEETKYKDVVKFYYNKLGKKPGAAAATRYGTITFEAPNGDKYKFFVLITTADFEKAGVKDLTDMSAKEKEKAINKMTNDIFNSMVKWLGTSRLPKKDQPAVKTGIKNMVTKLVGGIVEERSKVIELG